MRTRKVVLRYHVGPPSDRNTLICTRDQRQSGAAESCVNLKVLSGNDAFCLIQLTSHLYDPFGFARRSFQFRINQLRYLIGEFQNLFRVVLVAHFVQQAVSNPVLWPWERPPSGSIRVLVI